jgi:hypothetical protein
MASARQNLQQRRRRRRSAERWAYRKFVDALRVTHLDRLYFL